MPTELYERTDGLSPHFPSLSALLQPVIGNHTVRWDEFLPASIAITGDTPWDLESLQTYVDAAPLDGGRPAAKLEMDQISMAQRALMLTFLDYLNTERAEHSRAAVSEATFLTAVDTKIDTL